MATQRHARAARVRFDERWFAEDSPGHATSARGAAGLRRCSDHEGTKLAGRLKHYLGTGPHGQPGKWGIVFAP